VNYYQKCVKFALTTFEILQLLGMKSPRPLPGLCPWTPLGTLVGGDHGVTLCVLLTSTTPLAVTLLKYETKPFLSHSTSLAQNTLLMTSHSLIHLPPAHHSHPPPHIHCFIPGSLTLLNCFSCLVSFFFFWVVR